MATSILQKTNKLKIKILLYILSVVIVIYLVNQLIWGQNGFLAKSELDQSIQVLQDQLQEKQIMVDKLKVSLSLLDPENLDIDYVNEILRQELYWILPNEYLIVLP